MFEYTIRFFGEDQPIGITQSQYEALVDVVSNDKFIQVNNQLINTSGIKSITKNQGVKEYNAYKLQERNKDEKLITE